MRKRTKIVWMLMMSGAMLSCAAALSACDLIMQPEEPSKLSQAVSHLHSFGEWEETLPTCTESGSRVRACATCGQVQQEIIPALGHLWEDILSEEPTCTKQGIHQSICLRCETVETEILPPVEHTWSAIEVQQKPTCTEAGLRSAVCTECGKRENEQVIPATGHSFGEWQAETLPNCTEGGVDTRECSVCHHTESRNVDPLGHRCEQNFTVDIEPTLERAGEKSRHCLFCDYRADITPIEPLDGNTTFTIVLLTVLGEPLPACEPMFTVRDETGATVHEGPETSFSLPSKPYTVSVSGVPEGYFPLESYPISPALPACELRIPTSLLPYEQSKQPGQPTSPYNGTRFRIGDVMFDMKVQEIGLNPEDDRKVLLSEYFDHYKAVLFNLYFYSCSACVAEMPAFVDAYNTLSPTGKPYGEEVACLMLDVIVDYNIGEFETCRRFKRQTNFYLTNYTAAYNIPMHVIHEAWLRSFFQKITGGLSPCTVLVGSDGVILESHVGSMSAAGFTQMMQRGINRYNAILDWRVSMGLEEEQEDTISLPCSSIPALIPDKRRFV